MGLSRSQKVIKFFVSKSKFDAMSKESKQWVFKCTECQSKTSIWDLGGIRYKAKGIAKINLKCMNCGMSNVQLLFKEFK